MIDHDQVQLRVDGNLEVVDDCDFVCLSDRQDLCELANGITLILHFWRVNVDFEQDSEVLARHNGEKALYGCIVAGTDALLGQWREDVRFATPWLR